MSFIYLASQSPRRQELLHQIGVRFQLLLPDEHEDDESLELALPKERAIAYVKRVTLAKLTAASNRLQRRNELPAPILCADTTVAIQINGDDILLGKPEDDNDARRILKLLSGQRHAVHTAVGVHHNGTSDLRISSSIVTFKPLSDFDIDCYIASGEHLGKAGAYGIQGIAACFISHMEGSYSGIMGLPLFETAQLLSQADIPYAFNPLRLSS